jgi:hypothetical protein
MSGGEIAFLCMWGPGVTLYLISTVVVRARGMQNYMKLTAVLVHVCSMPDASQETPRIEDEESFVRGNEKLEREGACHIVIMRFI